MVFRATSISGSITRTTSGSSYLVGGTNINIVSSSTGQITISAPHANFDNDAAYLTLSATGSLSNERVLTAGTGISLVDAGAGSTATLAVLDSVVATISGTHFAGSITATGTGSFESGLSGSLTTLTDGTSYLIAGTSITISSASNGGITINSTPAGGSGDNQAQYVVLSATSSLDNERVLTAGTGISIVDAGAGSTVTLTILDSVVSTISGSHFTGNITVVGTGSFEGGVSGSLTNLTDGTSYIEAGKNISVLTGSKGQITISVPDGNFDEQAQYLTLATTSSLDNERVLTAGTGILLADGGAGGNATLTIHDSIVATISGSRFSNNITVVGTGSFETGISGSLTNLTDGRSYLVAGDSITITSASNGQVTINSTAAGGGSGDPNATYVVISTTSSLSAERVLAAGTGLSLTDAGAGNNATFAILDSVVATVSGTHFAGNITTTGTGSFETGISGSLTTLTDGTSYLIAGTNITISSASNGGITITTAGGSSADADWVDAGNIVYTTSSVGIGTSTPSTLLHITGTSSTTPQIEIEEGSTATGDAAIQFTIDAASGDASYAVGIDNSQAEVFTIAYSATPGAAVLGTNNRLIIDTSGNVVIGNTTAGVSGVKFMIFDTTDISTRGRINSNTTGIKFDIDANLTTTASTVTTRISAERVGSSANSDLIFSTYNGTSLTEKMRITQGGQVGVTGSLKVINGGITGSLMLLPDGRSYLAAGSNITLTSGSDGQITIASTGGSSTVYDTTRFSVNGRLLTGSVFDGAWVANRAGTVENVRLWRRLSGSSLTTRIDINKNGTSLYSNQDNKTVVSASAGDNALTGSIPDTGTSFSAGDYFTMDVDEIEAGEPVDLSATMEVSYT